MTTTTNKDISSKKKLYTLAHDRPPRTVRHRADVPRATNAFACFSGPHLPQADRICLLQPLGVYLYRFSVQLERRCT
jgi:hypothetical protein